MKFINSLLLISYNCVLSKRFYTKTITKTITYCPISQLPESTQETCSWLNHCLGSNCNTYDDCSDSLTCTNGICSNPSQPFPTVSTVPTVIPVPTCSWLNHCIGASCTTFDDCSDSLICINGICGNGGSNDNGNNDGNNGQDSNGIIHVESGNKATVTYFTDTVFQCITGQPIGNSLAVNPLLLGFTVDEWTNIYANANASIIPWCNKQLTLTVNGKSFTGTIIDTCDPVGNPFIDPNSGEIIGGKCGYDNVIDLHGDAGLNFLKNITNGDDFYQGALTWAIN